MPPNVEVKKIQGFQPDKCCARPLSRALKKNLLDDKDEWECPKCGCRWTAKMEGPIKHWSPVCEIEVWPRR